MSQQQLAVGIDIGGTNTMFGIVDRRGNIISEGKIRTADYPVVDDFMEALYDALMPHMQAAGLEQIKGIGIGAPNGNFYTGNIEFAPNLRWRGIIPLARLVHEKFHLPTALTNDANAAAVGEMTYGAAKGMKDFIMVTLGTGVGSGFVANGQLIYGHDGFAGELGHVIAVRDGRPCGCGRKGCLETYTSATGVVRTAREMIQGGRTSPLLQDDDTLTARKVFEAAGAGDQLAQDVFDYTGKILGQSLADAVAFTSPQAIILFGGLTQAGEWLFKPTRKYMEENLLSIYRNKVKIIPSDLRESDSAILGASALVWEL
jgi:glucokinase